MYRHYVVQLLSHIQLFATQWITAHQASLSFLSPGVGSNSCPSGRWGHPTNSSSPTLFSFCLQSFPTSGSFPMSQLFASGGQSIGASVSSSVLPMNIQDWFPLGLTGFDLLAKSWTRGTHRVLSNTIIQKHQFFGIQLSLQSNSHIHTWLLEKPWLWLYEPLMAKWCLCLLICCLGFSEWSMFV